MINKGKYQHFKGGVYEVLFEGTDSETLAEVVIYKSLADGKVWVRPREMFLETVNKDGVEMARFKFLGEE